LTSASHPERTRTSFVSALLIVLSLLILIRAERLISMYLNRLGVALGSGHAGGALAALVLVFILVFLGIVKAPRITAAAIGLASLFLIVRSGNAPAFVVAAGLLSLTLLAGDAVARLIRGNESDSGELPILIAAGSVAIGTLLLMLGEARLVNRVSLLIIAAALVGVRRRRIGELARQIAQGARILTSGTTRKTEALWITIVAAVLFLGFLGALRPDLSWDALSYHLPQVRDFAVKGHVEPLPNFYPITYLWHNYDTFLGLGYLAGGDRVVRLLHLAIGFAAFGATALLVKRLGGRGPAAPLALLAVATCPNASSQLMETYVDLAAALFLAAAAAELAVCRREPRRALLAGFLFGGAAAAKFFSLLGTVGLAALAIRRQLSLRKAAAVLLFAAISVVPWLAWNQKHLGFFLAPFADPGKAERHLPSSPTYGPRPDPRRAPPERPLEIARLFAIPYDLAFHIPRFGKSDGFTGVLALLMLVGAWGWDRKVFFLFCAAAACAVVPWYFAANLGSVAYSNRYLVPVFPLFAAFTAVGLARLTDGFSGRLGGAAAVAAAALAVALPLPFLTGPTDLRIAWKGVSPDVVLQSLPDYLLWKNVRREDRVLFLGEHDRYHCPASFVVNDVILHQARDVDPSRWASEWRPLGINVILFRSDWRDPQDLFESLGDCLQPIASRSVARLYRIDPRRSDCSPSVHESSPAGSEGSFPASERQDEDKPTR
jgi:hypothetical protein